MNYVITDIASAATFGAATDSRPTSYWAKFLLPGPDVAISVTDEGVQTFVDTVPVTEGAQRAFVAYHQREIRHAVTPLLTSFVRATIFGRWVVIRGTSWIEPYAVELADEAGNTELRGYDLHIFPSDDDPQSGGETSFTDADNEQRMSVLMGITEKIVRFDQVAKRETRPKGWPTGLFWFSDDQKACFAYEAIGQLAFAETPYARLAADWRSASNSSSSVEGPRP
ncbi:MULTISPECIES: hypothetical protein [unclassified Ensifer]|uniref:hypothetical protein n=1 Tax=unclassified Ensifer TaxID=2633371 RepID=UPI00070EC618|nr:MULTISPECIES: hypothetical protein [unclassified Ensifer]KQW33516.1 hypothetical protein ASD02_18910 [Ensifer sp. Root1252]KRC78690.1 hypothetical protein ASE32_26880 [Ensifer sp. Root231]KRD02593.1 hypothetical protein ASE47_19970 [Ensifer sp. Root258]